MFAVIKTGGKQYSVSADDQIRVEKLEGEAGDMLEFGEVLMVGDSVGTPFVDGAMVTAEIVEQGRARKVIAFKKRRRQNSRRTIGHRQHYTLIQISEILSDGKKPSKKSQGLGAARAQARADRSAAANAGAVETTHDDADNASVDAAVDAPVAKEAAPKKGKAGMEKAAPIEAKSEGDATPAAPLFTAPTGGEKDKLTDIKGIGPVAERQLNEQGITTFAQIAALSEDDIARVDEYMPFSAEQIRDWQGQAKDKA